MPSKTWGTKPAVVSETVISLNEEIPKGQTLKMVSDSKSGVLGKTDYVAIMNGDLTVIKQKIESEVHGVKVVYVKVSWNFANETPLHDIVIDGLVIETYIQNVNAGLTGLEIVAIIAVVAFLVTVVAVLGVLIWTAWRVITALEELGPAATAIGGFLLILMLLGFLLLLFGVRFSGSQKGVSVGK